MTPLQIEIMLHYHTRVSEYGYVDKNFEAPAVQEALIQFCKDGMLRKSGMGTPTLEITDKGCAYVDGLTDVNMQECHWHIPVDG